MSAVSPDEPMPDPRTAIVPVAESPVSLATHAAALGTKMNPRLAPKSIEAEQELLGGLLFSADTFFDVSEIVTADDFFVPAHGFVFAAMVANSNRGDSFDVAPLANELQRAGKLNEVGGAQGILELSSHIPASSDLQQFARIVADKARRRRLLEAMHSHARDAYNETLDTDALLGSVSANIAAISDARKDQDDYEPTGIVLKRVLDRMEWLFENKQEVTGVATGIPNLDKMTTGMQPKQLTVVAAKSSSGKSAFAINVAAHVAINLNLVVVILSLEMDRDTVIRRMLSGEARVDGLRMSTGRFLDADWQKLARGNDRVFRVRDNIHVFDKSGMTTQDMRARCRRVASKFGKIGLVVQDYIQIARGSMKTDSREQEVASISRELRAIAKEQNCPVMALSQLNKDNARRENKRPALSDMRESEAIANDADVVISLYRDEVANPESTDKGTAEAAILKNRHGPTGMVRLAFLREWTKFEMLANEQDGSEQRRYPDN